MPCVICQDVGGASVRLRVAGDPLPSGGYLFAIRSPALQNDALQNEPVRRSMSLIGCWMKQ